MIIENKVFLWLLFNRAVNYFLSRGMYIVEKEIKLIDEKVKAKSEFIERINRTFAGSGELNCHDRKNYVIPFPAYLLYVYYMSVACLQCGTLHFLS